MKRLLASIIIIVITFSSNLVVIGQEDHPLRAHVIDSLKVLEPRWSFDRSDYIPYMEDVKFEALSISWKAVDARVGAIMFIHLIEEDAAETYRVLPGQHIPKEHKVIETKLPNVGEESQLWGSEGTGYCHLYFRRGKVVVWVDASSREAAKDFAPRIAAVLPAT